MRSNYFPNHSGTPASSGVQLWSAFRRPVMSSVEAGALMCETQSEVPDACRSPWYSNRLVKPAVAVLACSGLLAGALLASRSGLLLATGTTFHQKQPGTFQTAYQAITDSIDASTTQLPGLPQLSQPEPQPTPTLSERFVTKMMAQVPGISKAQLDVRMVGQEVAGNHVTGHLVTLANPVGRMQLALPPNGCGTRELTTVTAKSHRPFCKLAINAGYFNVTDGACIGNVVSHGQIVQTVPLAQGNVNFGVKEGKFYIGYLKPEEMYGFDMLVSGVVWLVRDGKNNVDRGWKEANITVQTSGSKYATNLASRTAVGYDAQGRLIIVQVDGSIAVGDNKRGMDMKELANLLIQHGAVEAINLDGGGSSAMAHNGVLINYPSDNQPPSCHKSGLFQCERPVSTVLCIHEQEGSLASASASPGMSPGMYLAVGGAVGGLIFALGALSAILFLRYGSCGDDLELERQLSAESTMSVRDVRRT